PLALTADRRAGTLTLPARPGSYRGVLEAEHRVLTQRDGGNVTVKPDQPPVLLKFAGNHDLRAVRPSDRIPLEVRLADDVAVAEAHVEYRVNGGKEVREERMTLRGAGTREGVARHPWQLAGKVKQGDEVSYRVRFRDNLPRQFKGPHTVYYPADGWLRLKIVDNASPLRAQEIAAQ